MRSFLVFWFTALLGLSFVAGEEVSGVAVEDWGELKDGSAVKLITLGDQFANVKIATYGAQLVSLNVPDRNGALRNVICGHTDLESAENGAVYGSVIGRYANRIAGGGFEIDGTRYDLGSVNAKTGIQIHGGKTGFQRQNWQIEPDPVSAGFERFAKSITLKHISPAGHEGFPGNLTVWVQYRLGIEERLMDKTRSFLEINYRAETDHPTHVNLTNHAYFNLQGGGNILNHELMLSCSEILEFDEKKIPTGNILDVSNTRFDYRLPKAVGSGKDFEGLDHCFVIGKFGHVGALIDRASGIQMFVTSTEPGVQIYTANHFKGKPYTKFGAICFETQHYPNSPNQPDFPSTLLRPGEEYTSTTRFAFSGGAKFE